MQDLKPIKKAIILYAAATVIEQLLNRPKNLSDLSNEKFVIPKCSKSANDSAHSLVEAASRYCKR
ncbi:hypothetical protein [Staphylococcus chromogenes]|uniref:hypothetical protein n=1 Tax=Staphylococcus chromogenes TaxID=46126 RepID=UPI0029031957|nr:hypothetical protein [Staphylococcus chromogenes]MDU0481044.1 hypothetical protein [Staphylococcus chromogenes]